MTDTHSKTALKFHKELSSGLIALVLLSTLNEAASDLYGYEITKTLSALNPAAPVKLGAVYPVLRSLAAQGLLSSRIVPSYSGPPRRYYRITPLGTQMLSEWLVIWRSSRAFVDAATGAPSNHEHRT
jgi:PadR family transcriptional regulator PadR